MSASFFSSLSNESRLKIAMELGKGELSVNTLSKNLSFPQAVVSKGLKILTHAGVVRMRKQGVTHFYSLTNGIGRQAVRLMDWGRHVAELTESRLAQIRRDKQFQMIMDINPAPIVVSEIPSGKIVYANAAAFRFLAVRLPATMIGKNLFDFIDRPHHAHTKKGMHRIIKGDIIKAQRRVMTRTDKKKVYAFVASAPTFMFDSIVMVTLVLPVK